MTLTASVIADLSTDECWMPPCPLCSHVGVRDFADVLVTPTLCPNRRNSTVRIMRCCSLSRYDGAFASAVEAARWWREQRLNAPIDRADSERRAAMMERLRAAGYEGNQTQEPAPTAGGAPGEQGPAAGRTDQGELDLPQSVAGEQSAPCGSLYAPLAGQAESPACVSGSSTYMTHKIGKDWKCTVCGWQCPAPVLSR